MSGVPGNLWSFYAIAGMFALIDLLMVLGMLNRVLS
jgi:hypothetical protein